MTESSDLSTPARRKAALLGIDPDHPAPQHELLREIFSLEVPWRLSGADDLDDWFENVYQCAFLLHLIGDPADSPALASAKYRSGDMDLGIGFDFQFILGAGVPETLAYLESHGHGDLADDLRQQLAHGDDAAGPDLEGWVRWRRTYFYGETG